MRLKPLSLDLPAIVLTLAIGATGGLVARALGLPLALLLGSLCAVGVSAALGLRPLGRGITVPQKLRLFFVPVIGVAIGGQFTPQVVAEMPGWWPSLLGLCLYVPAAHWLGYRMYRRFGGLSPVTAYFGAVPGGLIESVALGEEAGADGRMLVLLQFLRLILTIVFVPILFTVLTGHAVGSSGGAALHGADLPLGVADVAVLVSSGVVGYFAGQALRLPAAIMTGPLLVSAAAHLAGLTAGGPPDWAVAVTQLVVGSVLGARFAGLPKGALWLALRLAVVNVGAGLVLAYGFALALAGWAGQPAAAVFLAYAPGGLTEMSLVALSLQMSVVFVTAHHVARIGLSVTVARLFSGRLPRA
jgi:membrane AbrB-like protein